MQSIKYNELSIRDDIERNYIDSAIYISSAVKSAHVRQRSQEMQYHFYGRCTSIYAE